MSKPYPELDDFPRAYVDIQPDGKAVLHDPDALGLAIAVEQRNCLTTARMQKDRILYFAHRMVQLNLTPADALITCINVDSSYGQELADHLMSGHDWQSYRDRGEIPFARGLAMRPELQDLAEKIDPDVGAKMRELAGVVVVFVVDHGVIAAFALEDVVLP